MLRSSVKFILLSSFTDELRTFFLVWKFATSPVNELGSNTFTHRAPQSDSRPDQLPLNPLGLVLVQRYHPSIQMLVGIYWWIH
eukprot:3812028-Pyramimonas_sp.AAC.1